MTTTDEFERMLHERRDELTARAREIKMVLAGLVELRDANADDEHDPDGAPVSGEWSRLIGIQRDIRAELSATDAALERIAAHDYGICLGCGGDIPHARLEARPTAELCIRCAERGASTSSRAQ